jgi:hypothetical protein
LLSSFVGALFLFGKDNLGKIEEIEIKGLDVDMIIVYKYNLILIVIMSKDFIKQDYRGEAEKALDMFYSSYVNEINNSKSSINISIFNEFKKILYIQIRDYFKILKDKERDAQRDFGFFTQAIKQLRNGQNSN